MTSDSPEKSRRDHLLGLIQKEYPSYHPLVSIARIAHHNEAGLDLQFKCHQTIAKYVEPELKSIEVKGGVDHRHRVSVSLFGDSEGGTGPVIEGSAVNLGPGALPEGYRALGAPEAETLEEETDRLVMNGW